MDVNFAKSLASSIQLVKPVEPLAAAGQAGATGNEFQNILTGVIGNVKSTRNEANQQISAFLNGEQTDIHEVATSIQKAGLTFELAIEVRNKAMQAYQEVMRMQI
jgi:flagellar hook-basal body complex protein FliE